jgi:hypothetical protein
LKTPFKPRFLNPKAESTPKGAIYPSFDNMEKTLKAGNNSAYLSLFIVATLKASYPKDF